jgi:hypothetical protein
MDEKSFPRVEFDAICPFTVAIDWRFVLAVVFLVLALLLR